MFSCLGLALQQLFSEGFQPTAGQTCRLQYIPSFPRMHGNARPTTSPNGPPHQTQPCSSQGGGPASLPSLPSLYSNMQRTLGGTSATKICRREVLADKTRLSEGETEDRLYVHLFSLCWISVYAQRTAGPWCICIPGRACVERLVDLSPKVHGRRKRIALHCQTLGTDGRGEEARLESRVWWHP